MKTTYLIRKNPSCGGVNPEWQDISGENFYSLVKSPEGKNRCFIKLENAFEDGSDGVIVMETTKEVYTEWRREKDRSDYIREWNQEIGYTTFSYHSLDSEDGDGYGEELLADHEARFEDSSINNTLLELLIPALEQLSPDEKKLIDMVYRDEMSLAEVGELLGITKQSVFRKVKKILTKLKSNIY